MPRLFTKDDAAFIKSAASHATGVPAGRHSDEMSRARQKLRGCVALARENARNVWQEPVQYRAEYRRIVRDSIIDARYWQQYIAALRGTLNSEKQL